MCSPVSLSRACRLPWPPDPWPAVPLSLETLWPNIQMELATPDLLTPTFRSQQSGRDEGRKEQGTNGKSVLPTPGFWRPSYVTCKGIACKVPAFSNKPQASAAQKPRSLFSFNRGILSTSFMPGHRARCMRYNREWNKKEPYPKRT